jgi:hypothetical protein
MRLGQIVFDEKPWRWKTSVVPSPEDILDNQCRVSVYRITLRRDGVGVRRDCFSWPTFPS